MVNLISQELLRWSFQNQVKHVMSWFKYTPTFTEKRVKVKFAQFCSTLSKSMDYTIHGILQARILKWVAFFSGSSRPTHGTGVSFAGRFFTNWAMREALEKDKPKLLILLHYFPGLCLLWLFSSFGLLWESNFLLT